MYKLQIKKIKHILLRKTRNLLFDEFPKLSYSRSGEDLLLNEIFNNKGTGTYVDVGCHDPIRNSNTYLFYSKGWRGLNIDANKEKIKLFNTARPSDINISTAISTKKGEIEYLEFEDDDSMNTINKNFYDTMIKGHNYLIKKSSLISCDTLENILIKNKDFLNEIDFMSIDVEGSEMEILHSNNWDLFRPKVLIIETELEHFNFSSSVVMFLDHIEYEVYTIVAMNSKLANIILIDRKSDIFKTLYSKTQ